MGKLEEGNFWQCVKALHNLAPSMNVLLFVETWQRRVAPRTVQWPLSLQILEAWLGRVGGAEPRRVPAAHLYLLHLSYSQMRIPGGTVRTALDESADHPARCGRVR